MEKILKREVVFQGHFLKVTRDSVELPSGKNATREFIQHSGAAVILAKNDKDEFLILQQYRHSFQRNFFEFPAGRRDGNEEFLTTAQRELKEETGYVAKTWSYLGPIHPCIGYADEVIHVYTASDLTLEATAHEEGEYINIFWKSREELKKLIQQNQLTDAKSLSVWMLYLSQE